MGQEEILFWKILELEITTKNPEFEETSRPCSSHLVLNMLGIRVQGRDKPFAPCKTTDKIYRRRYPHFRELIHVRKGEGES